MSDPTPPRPHPCRTCGACCATFRVSFYWAEGDDGGGTVPAGLTVPVSPFLRAMGGTERHPPRCVALDGEVGTWTTCRIHADRPSPCREFGASFEHRVHEPRCDAARARHGLRPLTPGDWPPHEVGVTRPEPGTLGGDDGRGRA